MKDNEQQQKGGKFSSKYDGKDEEKKLFSLTCKTELMRVPFIIFHHVFGSFQQVLN